jgi:hypothetical protein
MAADTDDALYEWSTTESNNKPLGTTTVSTNWDDNLRMIQKVVRGWLGSKGADIASAATTDLGAIEGYAHDITGSVTITSFGTVSAGIHKVVVFEGAPLVTHNATSLILPGGENIQAAAGDIGLFISEGSGNWRCVTFLRAAVSPNSGFSTGDVKLTIKTTADAGWVMMNDGTIGNAASGGTTRANADTLPLFTLIYNNTADADCAVSGGRGANAAADYAANKTIALPKALGRALAGAGAGSGLTSRALAKALGDENPQAHTHTGTTNTDGTHDHVLAGLHHFNNVAPGIGSNNFGGAGTTTDLGPMSANSEHAHAFTTASSGTGSAGNMQPSVFLNVMIKL